MNSIIITFIDEGLFTIPNTVHAYVEGNLKDNEVKDILVFLEQHINTIKSSYDYSFNLILNYYESAKAYPHLVGKIQNHLFFNRWQLDFKPIDHRIFDKVIVELEKMQLTYQGQALIMNVDMEYLA